MLKKILKFGVTGGLGTVTNLLLFFVFADLLNVEPHAVNVFCFFISCTQNYIVNHLWTFKETFKDEDGREKLSFKLWAKFLGGSLLGFAINMTVFSILLRSFDWTFMIAEKSVSLKTIPQGIGILCGMVFNFIFSNFVVFRKK